MTVRETETILKRTLRRMLLISHYRRLDSYDRDFCNLTIRIDTADSDLICEICLSFAPLFFRTIKAQKIRVLCLQFLLPKADPIRRFVMDRSKPYIEPVLRDIIS